MNEKNKKSIKILVIDDNDTMRDGMVKILEKAGFDVTGFDSGERGFEYIQTSVVDLVITDYKMDGLDGLSLLHKIHDLDKDSLVIVITAYGTIDLAVKAMKAGAWDFITKPFSKDELLLKADRAATLLTERWNVHRLSDENEYLREQVDVHFNFGEIVGESAGMKKVYNTIEKVSSSDTSVLIHGESGTGKELVARAIHRHSSRKNNAFVRVNCGALAEGVLESELFGHEKGAFTNAIRRKKGRFELAERGTLFLDEIGDIPLSTQVKLLRVLQEKEFERVGGEETLRVDVRLIAATHRDLLAEVKAGRFREDLYYRLYILPIELPPLRKRKEDIPLLVQHYLKRLGEDRGKKDLLLSNSALEALQMYDWPGNIRELANVLERAVVLAETSTLDLNSFGFLGSDTAGTMVAESSLNLDARLASVEKEMLEQAMSATGGVKAKAARLLGLKEATLYYKLEKHGLIDKE